MQQQQQHSSVTNVEKSDVYADAQILNPRFFTFVNAYLDTSSEEDDSDDDVKEDQKSVEEGVNEKGIDETEHNDAFNKKDLIKISNDLDGKETVDMENSENLNQKEEADVKPVDASDEMDIIETRSDELSSSMLTEQVENFFAEIDSLKNTDFGGQDMQDSSIFNSDFTEQQQQLTVSVFNKLAAEGWKIHYNDNDDYLFINSSTNEIKRSLPSDVFANDPSLLKSLNELIDSELANSEILRSLENFIKQAASLSLNDSEKNDYLGEAGVDSPQCSDDQSGNAVRDNIEEKNGLGSAQTDNCLDDKIQEQNDATILHQEKNNEEVELVTEWPIVQWSDEETESKFVGPRIPKFGLPLHPESEMNIEVPGESEDSERSKKNVRDEDDCANVATVIEHHELEMFLESIQNTIYQNAVEADDSDLEDFVETALEQEYDRCTERLSKEQKLLERYAELELELAMDGSNANSKGTSNKRSYGTCNASVETDGTKKMKMTQTDVGTQSENLIEIDVIECDGENDFVMKKQTLPLLDVKMRIQEMYSLCVNKLSALDPSGQNMSIQALLWQIKARIEDFIEQFLPPQYTMRKLIELTSVIDGIEKSVSPDGWKLLWNNSYKQYCYKNLKTGFLQWDFPNDDATDLVSDTKNPPEKCNREMCSASLSEDGNCITDFIGPQVRPAYYNNDENSTVSTDTAGVSDSCFIGPLNKPPDFIDAKVESTCAELDESIMEVDMEENVYVHSSSSSLNEELALFYEAFKDVTSDEKISVRDTVKTNEPGGSISPAFLKPHYEKEEDDVDTVPKGETNACKIKKEKRKKRKDEKASKMKGLNPSLMEKWKHAKEELRQL